MLVTRTDFEDVGDVGGYISIGQKCHLEHVLAGPSTVPRAAVRGAQAQVRPLLHDRAHQVARQGVPQPKGRGDVARPLDAIAPHVFQDYHLVAIRVGVGAVAPPRIHGRRVKCRERDPP